MCTSKADGAAPQQYAYAIFNEIVTSLEKVPVARQSARQFKAHEGKSIQLVSALLMRLVQTSGTRNAGTRKQADTKSIHASEDSWLSWPVKSLRPSCTRSTMVHCKRAGPCSLLLPRRPFSSSCSEAAAGGMSAGDGRASGARTNGGVAGLAAQCGSSSSAKRKNSGATRRRRCSA